MHIIAYVCINTYVNIFYIYAPSLYLHDIICEFVRQKFNRLLPSLRRAVDRNEYICKSIHIIYYIK